MSTEDRIDAALRHLTERGVRFGEAHHMAWTLDQVVRILTGGIPVEGTSGHAETLEYQDFIRKWEEGEHGPHTYEWDTGITP